MYNVLYTLTIENMDWYIEIFHHNVHLQMTPFFSKIKAYYPYIFLKKEERICKTRSILF
ncbi:hypothetical protein PT2222_130350 [Paraburkholderia tropica]